MALPPGVSSETFAQAIAEFSAAVGREWVFTKEDDIALYKDAYSPFWGEAEERVASAAVAPASVEEVQAICRIANRLRVPLYAISTGRNLGYGGSAPVQSGCVVVDLKRMNRIIEVSEDNAFALVEPGVSYFDLYRYIQEHKLNLWIDVPDPGWGSLVGNALDHGAGYTPLPYRDHLSAQCGMEVVLADGDVVRTGMGAMPGSKTWQQYKYGLGPVVDGMFSQSNFGIVTKMGFWLMPAPECMAIGTIRAKRHDDIHEYVRTMSSLMYSGIVDCHIWVYSPIFDQRVGVDKVFDAMLAKEASATEWDQYAAAKGRHFWETPFAFYGPKSVVKAKWEHTKEQYSKIPGIEFVDGPVYDLPLTRSQVEQTRDRNLFGIPSLSAFNNGRARTDLTAAPEPSEGHLWAAPVIPMTGEAVLEARRVFLKAFREWNVFPSVGQPQSYHWRMFVMLMGFPVHHDPEFNKKNRDTFRRMIDLATEHGWGEYRTHTAFMDQAMDAFSFNNHALMRFHERLKDAVDPNGILSPGRYGIWPKGSRKERK